MTHLFKHTLGASIGLTLLALTAHAAQAGTRPCLSCGSGSRPQSTTPPATFSFPSPTGGATSSFSYTPAAPTAPTATPAPRPTINPANIVRLQIARPR